jgi:hypothetical protein
MAAVRNLALGLLRRHGHHNIAHAVRHYAWNLPATLALIGRPIA